MVIIHSLKPVILLLLLLTWQAGRGSPVDSLTQALALAQTDSQRIRLYIELGFAHWDQQALEDAASQFQRALQLADQGQHALAQGQSHRYLGMLWAAQARYDSALRRYRRADAHFVQADNPQEWMKLKVDLGNAHYYLASYRQATRAYQAADSLAALVGGLSRERSIILGNLGSLLMEMSLPEQSLKYQRQAVALARRADDPYRLGTALHNLGGAYEVADSLDLAQQYFTQALAMADSLGYTRLQGYAHHSLSSLSDKLGRPETAVFHARQALALAQHPEEEILYRSRLGYFMGKQEPSSAAETLLLDALAQSEDLALTGHTFEIVGFLEEFYASRGDMVQAYRWGRRHRHMQDSLHSQEVEEKVRALELKYETEQKEKENLRLRADNQAQAARLRLQTTALVFSLLLMGIVGVAFYFYRKSQQGRRRLAEQEAAIQAQRIQEMEKERQLIAMQAMVDGQEAERSRLAKDLHDGLGGMLSTVRLQLSQIREEERRLREHADFLHAQDLLDKASTELRRIAHNLMPQALVRFGLQPALEDFLGDISQSKALQVDFEAYGLEERLSPAYELTVYRIIQELVNNVLKHARATEMLVQVLRRADRLYLTVEDNGRGFDPSLVGQGQGLSNLRSRTEYLQGKLEIASQPQEGTTIYLEFDLKTPIHDQTNDR